VHFFTSPVSAHSSRIIFRDEYYRKLPKIFLMTRTLTPVWHAHIFLQNEILDGDAVFLNRQSAKLLSQEVRAADYCMPAPADLCTRELYRWLRMHCKHGINYYPHEVLEPNLHSVWILDESM
jgi:hypothetical protein